MRKRTIANRLIASVISWLALQQAHPVSFAADSVKGPEPKPERRILTTQIAHTFDIITVADCERELGMWAQGRAYEKLAIAESLIVFMQSHRVCRVGEEHRRPGTQELSLSAGRAKWALERLLGLRLPFTVGEGTPEDELKRMYEVASCAVDAYRQGIMAVAMDQVVSPERLEDFRRRYQGRITPGFVEDPDRCMDGEGSGLD